MRGLYAITDTKLTPIDEIEEYVKFALMAGAKVIQLREKTLSDVELYPYAFILQKICENYGAKFIIDDRVNLANMVEADGVHVGKNDMDIERVKKEFKGIVGVSCYGDVEKAKEMESKGADYVAFGSFYKSPTKPGSNVVSKDVINKAKEELNVPICVIGGVTLENSPELIDRGADMVAVVSDLWSSDDIYRRAKGYEKLFKKE
ncbi:MAG: thiamine phosphate synthase [Campylobacterales bacterium]|nr:thiamine phosphate synthase [Campylobacterales bacterium]